MRAKLLCMAAEIDRRKSEIRAFVRANRKAQNDTINTAGFFAQLKLLVTAREARTLSCFYPVTGEPNTIPFINWALENELKVLLPKSRVDGLLDWVVFTGQEMQPGLFGVPEPAGETLSPLSVGDTDLMLIPACAIDRSGNRLGWGKGFFDRSISSMENRPPIFAVVHDNEILAQLPVDGHDEPVTGAVTPTQILYF